MSLAQRHQSQDSLLVVRLIREAEINILIPKLESVNRANAQADSALSVLEKMGKLTDQMFTQILPIKGTYFLKTGKYPEAIATWSRCLHLDTTLQGVSSRKAGLSINNLAFAYREYGDLDQAIPLFAKTVQIFRTNPKTRPAELATAIDNWGIALAMRGFHKQGAERFEEALKIKAAIQPLDTQLLAMTYNNLGSVYFEMGELLKAKAYFQKSLFLRRLLGTKAETYIPQSLSNLGLTAIEEEDFDAAITYLQQSFSLRVASGEPNTSLLGYSAINLGEAFYKKKNYAQALIYHRLGLGNLLATIKKWEHLHITNALNNIGNDYQALGNLDSALFYFKRSLGLRLQLLGRQNARVAQSYNELAELYLVQNNSSLAFTQLDSAMLANGVQGNNLKNILDWPALIRTFRIAAKVHYSHCVQVNFNQQAALKNLELIRFGVQALTLLENRGIFFSAPTSWQKDLYGFLEFSLATYNQLYQRSKAPLLIQEAFALSERAKSSTLLLPKLDEPLRNEGLQELKTKINFLETRINRMYEQGRTMLDTALLNAINRRNDVYTLLDQLRPERTPSSFPISRSLLEVQQMITRENSGILEFFVGEEHIFIFLIKKNATPSLFVVDNNFDLVDKVSQIQTAMRKEYLATAIPSYTQAAHDLYKILLAQIEPLLPFNLTIIPDGPLHLLPFELLLTSIPNQLKVFHSYPYYLHRHCFSYATSSAFLSAPPAIHIHGAGALKHILAMAPFASTNTNTPEPRQSLRALKGSLEEVQNLRALFPTTRVMLNAAASKDSFLRLAPAYTIIHIASHADANYASKAAPKLFFGPGSTEADEQLNTLYLQEIPTMRLQAALLVLSACETNQGRVLRGEGLISLARAFYNVGARSIVASLWKIDDPLTATIIRDFYTLLSNKKYKDEALHQAKLNFLKNTPSGLQQHPYYWAALVASGDMRPLE